MEVTLKQLTGQYPGRGGVMKTRKFPNDVVLVDGVEVAQVGHQPNAGIIFYAKYEEEFMKTVAAAVKSQRTNATGQFSHPPTQEQVIEAVDVLLKEAEADADEDDDEEDASDDE